MSVLVTECLNTPPTHDIILSHTITWAAQLSAIYKALECLHPLSAQSPSLSARFNCFGTHLHVLCMHSSIAVVGQSLFKYFLQFMFHVEVVERLEDKCILYFLPCWFSPSLSHFSLHSSSSRTHQYTWRIKLRTEQCRGTIQRRRHGEAEVRCVRRSTDAQRHVAPRRQSAVKRDLSGAQWATLTKWNRCRAFK